MFTAYSKFAHTVKSGKRVPSRFGMCMFYFPGFVTAFILMLFWPKAWYYCSPVCDMWSGDTFWTLNRGDYIVPICLIILFGKRCAECIWLHKFSSTRAARSASSLEEDDEEEKD